MLWKLVAEQRKRICKKDSDESLVPFSLQCQCHTPSSFCCLRGHECPIDLRQILLLLSFLIPVTSSMDLIRSRMYRANDVYDVRRISTVNFCIRFQTSTSGRRLSMMTKASPPAASRMLSTKHRMVSSSGIPKRYVPPNASAAHREANCSPIDSSSDAATKTVPFTPSDSRSRDRTAFCSSIDFPTQA